MLPASIINHPYFFKITEAEAKEKLNNSLLNTFLFCNYAGYTHENEDRFQLCIKFEGCIELFTFTYNPKKNIIQHILIGNAYTLYGVINLLLRKQGIILKGNKISIPSEISAYNAISSKQSVSSKNNALDSIPHEVFKIILLNFNLKTFNNGLQVSKNWYLALSENKAYFFKVQDDEIQEKMADKAKFIYNTINFMLSAIVEENKPKQLIYQEFTITEFKWCASNKEEISCRFLRKGYSTFYNDGYNKKKSIIINKNFVRWQSMGRGKNAESRLSESEYNLLINICRHGKNSINEENNCHTKNKSFN